MNLLMIVQQLFNFTDFITGLVFFLMGIIILLQFQQYKHLSDLKIVKKIWILALFGIIQGLAQWVGALTPISLAPHVPGYLSFWFNLWELLLNTVSYCFLYLFAVEVMALVLGRDYYLRLSVAFLSFLWIGIFLLSRSANWVAWINTSLTWSRFLLAFPGSILAGLALNLQAQEFEIIGIPNLVNNLYGAIASFCLYAIACGLSAPNAPLLTIFSGSWYATLADILRTISGLGMAGFIIRIMEIFNIENNKKLAAAQHREAILQERLRIGRDLHDGVIQSLYAIGLSLEVANHKIDTSLPKAKEILNNVLENLDGTIRDIRYFILDLTLPETRSLTWPDNLISLVESFSLAGLEIQMSYDVVDDDSLVLDWHKCQELLHVIRESLANVARHAQAQQVLLNIQQDAEQLYIRIADDGKGFILEGVPDDSLSGHGIKNMTERIERLGGELHIASRLLQGTVIQITVPIKGMIAPFQDDDLSAGAIGLEK